MDSKYQNRKATVACDHCGARHAVKVWSTGVIEPIDRKELCSCDKLDLRIVSADPPSDTTDE